jgi:hypothetical protein
VVVPVVVVPGSGEVVVVAGAVVVAGGAVVVVPGSGVDVGEVVADAAVALAFGTTASTSCSGERCARRAPVTCWSCTWRA